MSQLPHILPVTAEERRSPTSRLLFLLAGFAAVTAGVWAGSFALDDRIDKALLLKINPSLPWPGMDAFMLLVTDFSLPIVGVILLLWGLAAEGKRRCWITASQLAVVFPVAGIAVAGGVFAVLAGSYAHRAVPAMAVPLIVACFWWAGRSFQRWDDATLQRMRRAFWLTLASIALAELALEILGVALLPRPRPLAGVNAGWGDALRAVADERVRAGGSYPSGHAAAIFALLTPLFWMANSARARAAALGLALLCAYSRVYLAAHFPSDVAMGSLLGFAMAALVSLILPRRARGRPAPGVLSARSAEVTRRW